MSTYRERRAARAEKLREWAEKREARADAAFDAAHDATAGIPFGQPILVGHHSERRHRNAIARSDAAMSRGIESSRMASSMSSRADEIDRQAANAIYSDDPDAIERLQEKLAGLEAERERMKAENAAYRKEHRAELKAMGAYDRGQAVPHPSYSIQNLGGRITAARKRIKQLQNEAANGGPADRLITARFNSDCADCGATLAKGDLIRYSRANGARCAPQCEGDE